MNIRPSLMVSGDNIIFISKIYIFFQGERGRGGDCNTHGLSFPIRNELFWFICLSHVRPNTSTSWFKVLLPSDLESSRLGVLNYIFIFHLMMRDCALLKAYNHPWTIWLFIHAYSRRSQYVYFIYLYLRLASCNLPFPILGRVELKTFGNVPLAQTIWKVANNDNEVWNVPKEGE